MLKWYNPTNSPNSTQSDLLAVQSVWRSVRSVSLNNNENHSNNVFSFGACRTKWCVTWRHFNSTLRCLIFKRSSNSCPPSCPPTSCRISYLITVSNNNLPIGLNPSCDQSLCSDWSVSYSNNKEPQAENGFQTCLSDSWLSSLNKVYGLWENLPPSGLRSLQAEPTLQHNPFHWVHISHLGSRAKKNHVSFNPSGGQADISLWPSDPP